MGPSEPARGATNQAPIELQLASTTLGDAVVWMLGLAFGALMLVSQPDLLGARWLTWTVAGTMALLVPVAALFAWSDWRSRLVASAAGLEWRNGLSLQQRIGWSEVGAVRLVGHGVKDRGGMGFNMGNPAKSCVSRQSLQVLDRRGAMLMEFDEPQRRWC